MLNKDFHLEIFVSIALFEFQILKEVTVEVSELIRVEDSDLKN